YTETAFGMNLEMVYVEGGTFEMGATAEQGEEAEEDEYLVRTIKLDGYHIGKCEVTQAQWKAVMGTTLEDQLAMSEEDNGIEGEGSDYPMYYVNWTEAQAFCQKLSERTGKKYVLPTAAQWEYAARGGNKSQHYKYAGSNDVNEVAWHYYNGGGKTYPVGTKKANELCIYDMSGNVWEWCTDWYGNYDENDTDNPQGPAEGELRILRGGGCRDLDTDCHVLMWECLPPEYRCRVLGFRVAVIP
ncbi:MAG: formylglycine-generating enzyme family protein, partial [Bacteroidales bacterium]|nr:formylglycine-generating enzyme family protein [Bacteroidales bacterium]